MNLSTAEVLCVYDVGDIRRVGDLKISCRPRTDSTPYLNWPFPFSTNAAPPHFLYEKFIRVHSLCHISPSRITKQQI